HQPLIDAIFKCCGDAKGLWLTYLTAALFASRVTISRATGYSPYYLLYGVHPVFSFDMTESTWQTLDWDRVRTHEDLLAVRILQLKRRSPNWEEANQEIVRTRQKSIDLMHRTRGSIFNFHDYVPGMYVWLRESHLNGLKGAKGKWTYAGPYIIKEKTENGSYVLQELSGAVLKGHVHPQ
ncbi:hypothetical protein L218DRAFT_879948, partial [Marasmius fiardii PR-910]